MFSISKGLLIVLLAQAFSLRSEAVPLTPNQEDQSRAQSGPSTAPDWNHLTREIRGHAAARLGLSSGFVETGPILLSAEGIRVRKGKAKQRSFAWSEIQTVEVRSSRDPSDAGLAASFLAHLGMGVAAIIRKGEDVGEIAGWTYVGLLPVLLAAELLAPNPDPTWRLMWSRKAASEGDQTQERERE